MKVIIANIIYITLRERLGCANNNSHNNNTKISIFMLTVADIE